MLNRKWAFLNTFDFLRERKSDFQVFFMTKLETGKKIMFQKNNVLHTLYYMRFAQKVKTCCRT